MPRFSFTISTIASVVAPLVLFAATLFSAGIAPRAAAGEPMLSPSLAGKLGLTEAWRRALSVPGGSQSIVDQVLFVDRESTVRYVEIMEPANGDTEPTPQESDSSQAQAEPNEPKVWWRMRADQLDRFGNPVGEEEAKRLARNELRKLKRKGIEGTIEVQEVPTVLLYTLSNDGTLECRDAETGQSQWTTRVGDRGLGYRGLGIGNDYVSVINGANLLVLDAADGTILNERRTMKAPGPGCVHIGDYVLIPSVGSGIEGHVLSDPGAEPFFEQVSGAALQVPTRGPGTSLCAWPTANGFVYAMELEGSPSVLFRLQTDGLVDARIAADGDRFYFASDVGQVYALQATRSGKVLWGRPFGEPFYNPPSLHGNQMLLRSSYGNLYSLDIGTGEKTWDQPVAGIRDLLAIFDGRIFVQTLSGHLAVLSLETGDRLAEFHDVSPDKILINRYTNRLYLMSNTGTVQCLRPETSPLPQFKASATVAPQAAEERKQAPASDEPEQPATPADPFGAGESDPFAPGNNDPFGGGGDDPFGGAGNDPFGGGGF